jgi:dUTPase
MKVSKNKNVTYAMNEVSIDTNELAIKAEMNICLTKCSATELETKLNIKLNKNELAHIITLHELVLNGVQVHPITINEISSKPAKFVITNLSKNTIRINKGDVIANILIIETKVANKNSKDNSEDNDNDK